MEEYQRGKMTVKYECERCHRQTENRDSMTEITVRKKDGWGEDIIIRHYCSFCWLMMGNAFSIVDNGKYTGSINPNDKIGKQLGKELMDADPFYNPNIEFKE